MRNSAGIPDWSGAAIKLTPREAAIKQGLEDYVDLH